MATIKGRARTETIDGTSGNNSIDGNGGNDFIDGGAGVDTLVYFANRRDFTVTDYCLQVASPFIRSLCRKDGWHITL